MAEENPDVAAVKAELQAANAQIEELKKANEACVAENQEKFTKLQDELGGANKELAALKQRQETESTNRDKDLQAKFQNYDD
jgi:chromosome segregation ATPase